MMIKTQLTTDKLAVTFSMVCVLHCFFTPSFIILTSTLFSVSVNNEFIHLAILLAATPISLFALILGYKNHKIFSILLIGIMGLLTLTLALLLSESAIGEVGEKLMTLMGSILVSYSHFRNHQICKSLDCACHDS
jgi:hypothetical protein|tara:strand:- start:1250 stop:1654 length:405 start_codon:yes stop_codon:yes gene_type:complete